MHAMGGFAALLVLIPSAEPLPKAEVKVEKYTADFLVDGELLTRYHAGPKQSKPWFYPVNPLPGKGVTRPWPIVEEGDEEKDHKHHRSLWFCHGDIIPEGMEFVKSGDKHVKGVDFWSEGKNHGRIVLESMKAIPNGIRTTNVWQEPGGKTVLKEARTITLVPLGKNRNLLVFDIELTASEYPLTFNDTKEGSLGLRVRKTVALKSSKKGEMANSKGDSGELSVWGRVADWCDYSGPLGEDGPVGGIAIFADPKNKYDSAWHSRAYGLMAANPFGRANSFPGRKGQTDLVKLEKGETLKLRFAVFLHAGNAKEGKVAEAFTAFTKAKP
jgi:hypothetical protein